MQSEHDHSLSGAGSPGYLHAHSLGHGHRIPQPQPSTESVKWLINKVPLKLPERLLLEFLSIDLNKEIDAKFKGCTFKKCDSVVAFVFRGSTLAHGVHEPKIVLANGVRLDCPSRQWPY